MIVAVKGWMVGGVLDVDGCRHGESFAASTRRSAQVSSWGNALDR